LGPHLPERPVSRHHGGDTLGRPRRDLNRAGAAQAFAPGTGGVRRVYISTRRLSRPLPQHGMLSPSLHRVGLRAARRLAALGASLCALLLPAGHALGAQAVSVALSQKSVSLAVGDTLRLS